MELCMGGGGTPQRLFSCASTGVDALRGEGPGWIEGSGLRADPAMQAIDRRILERLCQRLPFAFGSAISVSGFGLRTSGFRFWVYRFGFRVSGFGFRVSGLGFWVPGFRFRVQGLSFPARGRGGCRSANSRRRVSQAVEHPLERQPDRILRFVVHSPHLHQKHTIAFFRERKLERIAEGSAAKMLTNGKRGRRRYKIVSVYQ